MQATAKASQLREGRAGTVLVHGVYIALTLCFVIPLLMVVSISLSTERELTLSGFQLIPREVTAQAYEFLFKNPGRILSAYRVTVITSVASLFLYLLIASMCAYAISRRDFAWRGIVTFYMFFTMLFSGGLVPYYILCTQYLHLRDSLWALILTQLGNVWYIFIMRTYFQDIPASIIESATIDGASEWAVYTRILLPLSLPSLATIGLLQFLGFWNSWFGALLFITDKNLVPLQYLLQTMLRNVLEIKRAMQGTGQNYVQMKDMPTEPLQMAMCMVAIGPIMLVFPFFQKYFVKGLTIGSVKG